MAPILSLHKRGSREEVWPQEGDDQAARVKLSLKPFIVRIREKGSNEW